MRLLPWIAVGGAVGAVARFGVSAAAGHLLGARLPWGTLAVNVLGSICLGVLLEWFACRQGTDERLQILLTTGLMGAFTTFSTFSVETIRLIQRGDLGWGAANVLGNVVLSLLGAAAGVAAVRYLHGSGVLP